MNRIGAILFLSFLILAPWAYDLWAQSRIGADPNSDLLEKARRVQPEVIAIGTSRFSAGLDTRVLNKDMIIISFPFMDIEVMDLIVDKHYELLKKSRLVYLEFCPEMLYGKILTFEPEAIQRLAKLGIPGWNYASAMSDPSRWEVGSFFPNLTVLRFAPRELLISKEDKRTIQNSRKEVLKNNGYIPRRTPEKDNVELDQASQNFFKALNRYQTSEAEARGIEIFKALVEKLNRHGVKYCWLEMPKYKTLAELSIPTEVKLRNAIQGEVPEKSCYDTQKFQEARLDLKFDDPNHLLSVGAEQFTRFLKENIRD